MALLIIGYFGMWEDTMKTISMIFVCDRLIYRHRHSPGYPDVAFRVLRNLVNPVLDVMQTMPSFVYLIPG